MAGRLNGLANSDEMGKSYGVAILFSLYLVFLSLSLESIMLLEP
jgi:hypothetical protein